MEDGSRMKNPCITNNFQEIPLHNHKNKCIEHPLQFFKVTKVNHMF